MKRTIIGFVALIVVCLAAWQGVVNIQFWRYAHRSYVTEEFDTPTFTVQIPKGWEKPDYANPRESKALFATGSTARDEQDADFVYSRLEIDDHGDQVTVDSVMADWRKDATRVSRTSRTRLGGIDAWTWKNNLAFADMVGESRTFVFRGTNGHVYSSDYALPRATPYRMRQDYVFRRMLSSLKFHEPRDRSAR